MRDKLYELIRQGFGAGFFVKYQKNHWSRGVQSVFGEAIITVPLRSSNNKEKLTTDNQSF